MSSLVSAIGEAVGISKNSIRGLTTFISDVRACTYFDLFYSLHLELETSKSEDLELAALRCAPIAVLLEILSVLRF